MQPDEITFLSYGLIGYLLVPAVVLLMISLRKEIRYGGPIRGIFWFGVAMMTVCAVVILFVTLHRATTLEKRPVRVETRSSDRQ